jgi:hypothetical protein
VSFIEFKDIGITVTRLMLGATETDFFERADLTETEIFMKALVWHGKEDIRYDTVSDPEIEDDIKEIKEDGPRPPSLLSGGDPRDRICVPAHVRIGSISTVGRNKISAVNQLKADVASQATIVRLHSFLTSCCR